MVFNKSLGKLVGFTELSEVTEELRSLGCELQSESGTEAQERQLADHMLVVRARSIFKPSFTFPVAQYPTCSLTGEDLYPLLWNVVEALELNEIEVNFITCDGLSANRKFFRISQDNAELKVPYKTRNPYDQS